MHGWPCKFYDNGIVKVGTKAARFTLRAVAGEHFASLLRAELLKRKLAQADELQTDIAGQEALAAVAEAAAERAAARKAAAAATRAARESVRDVADECCCNVPGGMEAVRNENKIRHEQLTLMEAFRRSHVALTAVLKSAHSTRAREEHSSDEENTGQASKRARQAHLLPMPPCLSSLSRSPPCLHSPCASASPLPSHYLFHLAICAWLPSLISLPLRRFSSSARCSVAHASLNR